MYIIPEDFSGERAPVDIKLDAPPLPLENVTVVHSDPDGLAESVF
jgi:hypothetical protein